MPKCPKCGDTMPDKARYEETDLIDQRDYKLTLSTTEVGRRIILGDVCGRRVV